MEIANYAGVAKQIGVGALCCLTWIMMDIKIYVCNGIYHDLTNQDFVDFFANEFMQKMVITGKRRNKNDYKQNAKYGDSKLCVQKQ
jgi:uncharacterized CHY-type Zn-finger protein